MKYIAMLFCVSALLGCTVMVARRDATGVTTVKTIGAPFVNREASIRVVDSWLDNNNVLHETVIEQSGKENTDKQIEILRAVLQAGFYESKSFGRK